MRKNYDKASLKPVIRVSICHGEQVTDRKTKNIWLHVFSLVIISMALIMKFVNVAYPAITLVLWLYKKYMWIKTTAIAPSMRRRTIRKQERMLFR